MITETAIEQYERTTGRRVDGTLIEPSNVTVEATIVAPIVEPDTKTNDAAPEVVKEVTPVVAPKTTRKKK